MKKRQLFYIVFIFITLFLNVQKITAQNFNVPRRYSFKKLEDYKKYEKDILKCIEYLEQASVNDLSENRKKINSFFLEWLTGVPYVHITVNSAVMDLCKENGNFLIIFMGGWTKYSLSNPADEEAVNGYLAGIESIIKVYQKGNGVVKDLKIEELIKIQRDGKLKDWVIKQI